MWDEGRLAKRNVDLGLKRGHHLLVVWLLILRETRIENKMKTEILTLTDTRTLPIEVALVLTMTALNLMSFDVLTAPDPF